MPHSGQSFQFAFTGWPQAGQAGRPMGVSHAGQSFQPVLSGSPQAGQRLSA
jgi:hypothetical protein